MQTTISDFGQMQNRFRQLFNKEKNIKVDSVLTLAEIPRSRLLTQTAEYIDKVCSPTYTDNNDLGEHIYSMDQITEEIEDELVDEPPAGVKDELNIIASQLAAKEIGYFRLIKE